MHGYDYNKLKTAYNVTFERVCLSRYLSDIDGAVATIMAFDRAIRCGNTNIASVYDDRGILFI